MKCNLTLFDLFTLHLKHGVFATLLKRENLMLEKSYRYILINYINKTQENSSYDVFAASVRLLKTT